MAGGIGAIAGESIAQRVRWSKDRCFRCSGSWNELRAKDGAQDTGRVGNGDAPGTGAGRGRLTLETGTTGTRS